MSSVAFKSKFLKGIFDSILRLVLIIAVALNGIIPAYAQSISIDTGASPSNQPNLDAASNGVPILNIVAPNGAGVSHNKFTNYNVDRQGLILNNGKTLGQSQLGGIIQGNPNLRNTPNASLIINEVTSSNKTALNGFTEVYGKAADLVIANPNGITVNGGGFINVPRATLTTGVPQFSANGALSGITVDKGSIAIEALGLDATQSNILDIVTRSAQLNGYIHGKDVALNLGAQDFNYVTRTTTGKTGDAATKPTFALDSTALGGISADSIRIVGTEQGVGVRAPQKMAASSGDLMVTANGQLVLRSATARKRFVAKSTASSVRVEGSINAREAVEIDAADSAIFANGSAVSSGQSIEVAAADIELEQQSNVSAGIDEAGNFSANTGLLSLAATQTLVMGQDSVARGGAGAALSAQTKIDNNGGTIRSDQTVSITTPTFNNAGSVLGNNIVADISTLLSNSANGLLRAGNDLTFAQRTATVDNEGVISAGNQASIDAGSLNNKTGAEIISNNALLIKAANLTNDAVISSENGLTADIDNKLTNNLAGSIQSLNGALGIAALEIENAGLIGSGGTLSANVDVFRNNAGTFISLQDLTIEGQTTGDRSTLVVNDQGAIESLDGDILIRAETLENLGKADITTETTQVHHQFRQTGPPSWVLNLPPSFYRALISDAGFAQLSDGGRTRTYVFAPHPDKLAELLVTTGKTIDQWTATDWQAHAPTSQATFDPAEWVIFVPDEARHAPPGSDVIVITETDVLDGPIKQATIATGQGNITLDTVNFTNRVGTVSSAGDLVVDAVNIVNEGFELRRNISVKLNYSSNDTVRSMGWSGWFSAGNPGPRVVQRDDIGEAPATISAVGNLTGTASGSVVNAATLASVPASLSFANTSDTLVFTGRGGDTATGIGFNPSLFTPAPDGSLYLLETRAAFIDPSLFFGSEYFLQRLGYSPEGTLRLLGDAYFETRLIIQAILDKTGNRYLDPDVTSDQEQLKRLIEAGVVAAKDLQLVVGVALTEEQQAALTTDIVWQVEVEVNGEKVRVLQLYLSKKTLDQLSRSAAVIAANGKLDLSVVSKALNGSVVNTGTFRAGEFASESNTFINRGVITSVYDSNIIADQFDMRTTPIRTGDGNKTGGYIIERQPKIVVGGNLGIDGTDVRIRGGLLDVGGNLQVDSQSFSIKPVQLELFTKYQGDNVDGESYQKTFIVPKINVGGNFELNASKAALIQAAKINVNEDLIIRAGELLIDSVAEESRNKGRLIKDGFKKGETTWEYITINQIPTVIETGGNVHLIAGLGNATIRASNISSGGELTVEAPNGEIRFETAFGYELKRDTKTGESLVWVSSSDKGEEKKYVIHSDLRAANGLNFHAGEGLVVQYRKGLNFEAAVGNLGDLNGLAWMAELHNKQRNDVKWQQVAESYNSWNEKSGGLSGPAQAVLALAVAIATQGAGSALVTNLGITNAAAASAFKAGFSTLVSSATSSLGRNGFDISATFDDLISDDFAKMLAISVFTAGLTTELSQVAGLDKLGPVQNAEFANRLKTALVRAGVGTVVETTITGADFKDSLLGNLISASAQAVSAEGAELIGKAAGDENRNLLAKYLAHAGLGCVIGATAGECKSGAVGGLTGAAASDLYDKITFEMQDFVENPDAYTPEQRTALFEAWHDQGVNLSKFAAASLASALGENEDIAANQAGIVAENNVLPAVIVAVRIGLAAYTVYELVETGKRAIDIIERLQSGEEIPSEELRSMAISLGFELAAGKVLSSKKVFDAAVEIAKKANVGKRLDDLITKVKIPNSDAVGVPRAVGADIPSVRVNNIGEFFQTLTGGVFQGASRRTSKVFQGQRVYVAKKDIILQDGTKIRKGDQFYLDGLHKNHLEVFDSQGSPRIKVDLSGKNLGDLPKNRKLQ
jgi:filamentous hemagglutinin